MKWDTKSQNQKFFSLQTRRLAESFKGLNSSLAQLSAEIFSRKTCANCWILALAYRTEGV